MLRAPPVYIVDFAPDFSLANHGEKVRALCVAIVYIAKTCIPCSRNQKRVAFKEQPEL